jgi:streptogramin lyase
VKNDVAEEDFDDAKNLWFEACLEVTGKSAPISALLQAWNSP